MEEKKEFNYMDTDSVRMRDMAIVGDKEGDTLDPVRSSYPKTMVFSEKVIADMMASADASVKATKTTRELANAIFGDPCFKAAKIETANVEEKEPEEEWIWVQGYKGTDKNMRCRDYQYELNKQYDMPEGSSITTCNSGFHFCTKLKSVFSFYDVRNNNRFFKVTALVRKSDYNKCVNSILNKGFWFIDQPDKLAAKSIIFTEEVTDEELFEELETANATFKSIPQEFRYLAREHGANYARTQYEIKTLIADGYSEAFADYAVKDMNEFEMAHRVAAIPDLSMDMKVLAICKGYWD